jgi:hypothetical protein
MGGFWTWRLFVGLEKLELPSSSREKNSAGQMVLRWRPGRRDGIF